jgi:pimeloyl-ACP methyl ester carboxylesterase
MKGLLVALLLLGLAYGAIVGLIAWRQEDLLYLPLRASLAQLESGGLRAWPTGRQVRGLVAEPGAARATVLVFHGNAGHAGDRAYYAQALLPLGLRVVLAEYPGYGPRGGSLGEQELVADALQTLALTRQMYPGPLILIGESLGAGVASAAFARRPEAVDGLLLITPWDSLANVAQHHYRWLPVRWLLRDRYDNMAHLGRATKPVVVAVAEHDEIVPARFGVALYQAIGGTKRLAWITGAGHNDWLWHVDERWWRETLAFLQLDLP